MTFLEGFASGYQHADDRRQAREERQKERDIEQANRKENRGWQREDQKYNADREDVRFQRGLDAQLASERRQREWAVQQHDLFANADARMAQKQKEDQAHIAVKGLLTAHNLPESAGPQLYGAVISGQSIDYLDSALTNKTLSLDPNYRAPATVVAPNANNPVITGPDSTAPYGSHAATDVTVSGGPSQPTGQTSEPVPMPSAVSNPSGYQDPMVSAPNSTPGLPSDMSKATPEQIGVPSIAKQAPALSNTQQAPMSSAAPTLPVVGTSAPQGVKATQVAAPAPNSQAGGTFAPPVPLAKNPTPMPSYDQLKNNPKDQGDTTAAPVITPPAPVNPTVNLSLQHTMETDPNASQGPLVYRPKTLPAGSIEDANYELSLAQARNDPVGVSTARTKIDAIQSGISWTAKTNAEATSHETARNQPPVFALAVGPDGRVSRGGAMQLQTDFDGNGQRIMVDVSRPGRNPVTGDWRSFPGPAVADYTKLQENLGVKYDKATMAQTNYIAALDSASVIKRIINEDPGAITDVGKAANGISNLGNNVKEAYNLLQDSINNLQKDQANGGGNTPSLMGQYNERFKKFANETASIWGATGGSSSVEKTAVDAALFQSANLSLINNLKTINKVNSNGVGDGNNSDNDQKALQELLGGQDAGPEKKIAAMNQALRQSYIQVDGYRATVNNDWEKNNFESNYGIKTSFHVPDIEEQVMSDPYFSKNLILQHDLLAAHNEITGPVKIGQGQAVQNYSAQLGQTGQQGVMAPPGAKPTPTETPKPDDTGLVPGQIYNGYKYRGGATRNKDGSLDPQFFEKVEGNK